METSTGYRYATKYKNDNCNANYLSLFLVLSVLAPKMIEKYEHRIEFEASDLVE
jgi:hypothetical protein